MMVKYKSEWKDVRAAFWLGMTIGFGIAWIVVLVVTR